MYKQGNYLNLKFGGDDLQGPPGVTQDTGLSVRSPGPASGSALL